MGLKLAIVYERSLALVAAEVHLRIERIFPMITVSLSESLEIAQSAWDTFRGQYDIHYLLSSLEVPKESELILWLIKGDMGDPWHAYLYGAAGNQRAIVSTARLEQIDDVGKEACHEVGHLLGLSHCLEDCVMHTSWTARQVERKPDYLCKACRTVLEEHK